MAPLPLDLCRVQCATQLCKKACTGKNSKRSNPSLSAPQPRWPSQGEHCVRSKGHATLENAILRRRSTSAPARSQDPERFLCVCRPCAASTRVPATRPTITASNAQGIRAGAGTHERARHPDRHHAGVGRRRTQSCAGRGPQWLPATTSAAPSAASDCDAALKRLGERAQACGVGTGCRRSNAAKMACGAFMPSLGSLSRTCVALGRVWRQSRARHRPCSLTEIYLGVGMGLLRVHALAH
jgi:hypothetical protein